MPLEPVPTARPSLRLRADLADSTFDSPGTALELAGPAAGGSRWFDRIGRPSVVALAAFFVALGAAQFDLSPAEAKLGLAVGEALGPFGRSFGYWDPATWPLPVAIGQLAGWFEDEGATQNAVRWPAALAGCLIGYLLTRRGRLDLNPRAGVMVALAWFGSLALMDRSNHLWAFLDWLLCAQIPHHRPFYVNFDLLAGLGTVAALDRLLSKGAGWVVGLWASWAFLAGGWPPVAILILATVVLGLAGSTWNWRTSVPVAAAFAGWSAWALAAAPAEAWASALTLPITRPSAWGLAGMVLLAGCPWAPFVALMVARSVRESWVGSSRGLVVGWLQVAGACLVAGSIIPGLATAASVPALAGLAFVAAAVWDRLWAQGAASPAARRTLGGLLLAGTGLWLALVLSWGGYVGFTVAYYRAVMIGTLALSVVGLGTAIEAVRRADPRRGYAAVVLVAVALKLAHWGYFVPEMNYRTSAGPWGRAIGQWVPEGHSLYTLKPWPADLAYAINRPVRQLKSPRLIEFQPGKGSKFLLLSDTEYAEYEHWPDGWPKLVKVAQFADESGEGSRVLARTEGPIILGHPHKKNSAYD